MNAKPFEILIVEDNPGDVRLAMEALQEGEVAKNIHVAEDGVAALEYLCSDEGRQHPPDLILLDLNLPRRHGHEVLAGVREDERLRTTPVIIFTSSAAEPDVRQAYDLHANCYVTKPSGFAELSDAIRKIETFWLVIATLPSRVRA
jgi:two-component system, chemotaxis family, response regulator Rcp1